MFYNQVLLAKKGPLGKIWLAAHGDRKLSKQQVLQIDVENAVETIENPPVPLALRVSGHLLLGVVRIYARKAQYLVSDSSDAVKRINEDFRTNVLSLPPKASKAGKQAMNVVVFGEFRTEHLNALDSVELTQLELGDLLSAASQSAMPASRRHEITLAESVSQRSKNGNYSAFHDLHMDDSFGYGDMPAFDFEHTLGRPGMRNSFDHAMNDIEVGRNDSSAMPALNESQLLGSSDGKSIIGDLDHKNYDNEFAFDDGFDGPSDLPGANELPPSPLNNSHFSDNASHASMDLALANIDEDQTTDGTTKSKKRRRVERDTVTQLSGSLIRKNMKDTSRVTQTRDLTHASEDKTGLNVDNPDLFKTPCQTDMADDLKDMYTATMKKSKFPYLSARGQVEDVEQMRRMSHASRDQEHDMNDYAFDQEDDRPQPMGSMGDKDRDSLDFDFAAPEPDRLNDLDTGDVDLDLGVDIENEEGIPTANSASTDHKWHPNTVKVMKVLQATMKGKEETTYETLTKPTTSKRTAAALFCELLQLKTLDYVRLNQSEAYGDISIARSDRFPVTSRA